MILDEAYADLLTKPSDMQKHMPTLAIFAHGLRVIEFGTRRGVSTVAMLHGRPRSLIAYDMVRTGDVARIEAMANEAGIPFEFRETELYKVAEIPPCDAVFVDWLHNADAVRHSCQLAKEAGAISLAFHDTESFKHAGDLPGTRGVRDGVDDFLKANPGWAVVHHNPESYGLTIISKAGVKS